MITFNAIDVETANTDRSSICQIGIVHVRGGQVVDRWQTLVNPQDRFDPLNVRVHGITDSDVQDSPTLPEVRDELRRRLFGSVLVSHTSFDRVAFERAMAKHRLGQIRVTWLDSAQIVRRAWPDRYGKRGYGLKNVATDLGISFDHHQAVEDARAAAEVVIRACRAADTDVEGWVELLTPHARPTASRGRHGAGQSRVRRRRLFRRMFGGRRDVSKGRSETGGLPASSPESLSREGTAEGALFGETLVFTGRLGTPRRVATDRAAVAGCRVATSVGSSTTMLVVGDLNGHKKSRKQRTAEALIGQGANIQILSESDFLELIGGI